MTKLTYKTYPGVDHGGAVKDAKSAKDATTLHPQPPQLTMAREFAEANAAQRGLRRFAASGPGSWLFARMLDRLDRLTFRVTKGKHMFSSMLSALPVAMVTTSGARSGQSRTVPLLAMRTDDGLAIIGSNYGRPKHPAWRHNLRAEPEGAVEVEGDEVGLPRRRGRGRAPRADLERGAAHLPRLRRLCAPLRRRAGSPCSSSSRKAGAYRLTGDRRPDSPAFRLLSDVVLAMAGEREVEPVLQRLVHAARELGGARYAALGVPDGEGAFARFITSGMSEGLIEAMGPLPRTHGLLGAMLESPEPYRIDDIHTDPRFRGWWPAAHPDMRSFLGVPVVARGA